MTSISYSINGRVNGLSLYALQTYSAGQGVAILPLTSVTIQYNGPQSGLTIGTSGGGIALPTGNPRLSATLTSLTYNNGQVTNASGGIFWTIFPLGFGGRIQNELNQNPGALAALQKLSQALGTCATQ